MAPLTIRQKVGLFLMVAAGIILRAGYWHATHSTLEDAFITFRYADNLAAGNGFVYNLGEHVLGTTTPLWTLILAGLRTAVAPDVIACAKVLGLLLDCISMLALFWLLRSISLFAAFLGTALFASSPALVPITVSGMETPLLLAGMSVALLGYQRRNALFGIGLTITVLTRIDGSLFALVMLGAALISERRWALAQGAIAVILCLPWFLFSAVYFGTLVPQSALAKRAVYNLDIRASLEPFLVQFTPWGEGRPTVLAVKCAFFFLLLSGLIRIMVRDRQFYAVALFFLIYTILFATSGILVFSWYLVPALFASCFIIASGAQWCLLLTEKLPVPSLMRFLVLWGLPLSLCSANLYVLHARLEHSRQLQGVEDNLRTQVGLWLHANAPEGSQVFLEPIGYMGYYAGPTLTIHDEVGLVTPAVLKYRASGDGWYTDALKGMKPDYAVQYSSSLEQNTTEGANLRLFRSDEDREWFLEHYRQERVFDVTESYPLIAFKEKKFVILVRVKVASPPLPGGEPQEPLVPVPAHPR